MKTLNEVAIEGNFLHIEKSIYEKFTPNIILNCEKMKAFLLRSECRS